MTSLRRRLLLAVLPPVVVFAIVVAFWHAATVAFDIQPYVLPSPARVFDAASANAAKIARAAMLTGGAALCGLGASLAVGVLVAFAFSQSRLIRGAFYPYAIFLQTVPIVAIAPVIAIWVGQDFRSVVLVAHIVSLFPVVANATHGLTSVDRNLLELFEINNAARAQTLLKLRFPNAIPHIVTGVRTSSGLSVIGAIVGEFFAGYDPSSQGLGYLIQSWSGQSKSAELYAAVFASTLLGLAIFGAASLAGAIACRRWRDAG